jgi:hypothetical protein
VKHPKPFVYIASPYTKGDPCINARFQCATFDVLLGDGLVLPYAPLISHFQHTMFPRPYQDWVQYDLDIIPRFDACLRLDAVGPNGYAETRSSGADGEVALFKQLGKPVFYSVVDLYEWARRLQREGGPL